MFVLKLKTMLDLFHICASVQQIAREAGLFLKQEREAFDPEKIEEKGLHNYVSYVDKASEKMLIEKLGALLPGSGFIAEEGSGCLTDETYYWVIDPLDGTSNFIHNSYPYAVSIALRTHEEILLGVVYEVGRDECFYAIKSGKAYLNGKEIRVSGVNQLDKAFIGLGLPYNVEGYKPIAEKLLHSLYGRASGLRLLGAAAPEICYIACGRYDARIEAFLGEWDVAAAGLILECAGGKLTDFKGKNNWLPAVEVLASNGQIHSDLLNLL